MPGVAILCDVETDEGALVAETVRAFLAAAYPALSPVEQVVLFEGSEHRPNKNEEIYTAGEALMERLLDMSAAIVVPLDPYVKAWCQHHGQFVETFNRFKNKHTPWSRWNYDVNLVGKTFPMFPFYRSKPTGALDPASWTAWVVEGMQPASFLKVREQKSAAGGDEEDEDEDEDDGWSWWVKRERKAYLTLMKALRDTAQKVVSRGPPRVTDFLTNIPDRIKSGLRSGQGSFEEFAEAHPLVHCEARASEHAPLFVQLNSVDYRKHDNTFRLYGHTLEGRSVALNIKHSIETGLTVFNVTVALPFARLQPMFSKWLPDLAALGQWEERGVFQGSGCRLSLTTPMKRAQFNAWRTAALAQHSTHVADLRWSDDYASSIDVMWTPEAARLFQSNCAMLLNHDLLKTCKHLRVEEVRERLPFDDYVRTGMITTRVFADSPNDLRRIVDRVKDQRDLGYRCFSTDVEPAIQFLMETGLTVFKWIRVTGVEEDCEPHKKETFCAYEFSATMSQLSAARDADALPDMPPRKIMAYDIETHYTLGLKNNDAYPIISIGVTVIQCTTSEVRNTRRRFVFSLYSCPTRRMPCGRQAMVEPDSPEPAQGLLMDGVFAFRSERDLLAAFVRFIQAEDPFILTGHNVLAFDWRVVLARCQLWGVPFVVSSVRSEVDTVNMKETFAANKGRRETYNMSTSRGRCYIDSLYITANKPMLFSGCKMYNLNYLSEKFLKSHKEDMPYSELPIAFRTPAGRCRLNRYCIQDVDLCLDLLLVKAVFREDFKMTEILGLIPYVEVVERGQLRAIQAFFFLFNKNYSAIPYIFCSVRDEAANGTAQERERRQLQPPPVYKKDPLLKDPHVPYWKSVRDDSYYRRARVIDISKKITPKQRLDLVKSLDMSVQKRSALQPRGQDVAADGVDDDDDDGAGSDGDDDDDDGAGSDGDDDGDDGDEECEGEGVLNTLADEKGFEGHCDEEYESEFLELYNWKSRPENGHLNSIFKSSTQVTVTSMFKKQGAAEDVASSSYAPAPGSKKRKAVAPTKDDIVREFRSAQLEDRLSLMSARAADAGAKAARAKAKAADKDGEKKVYPGGLVLAPMIGVHDYVNIMDFASLYPSIMMAYNFCITTKLRQEDMAREGVHARDVRVSKALARTKTKVGIHPAARFVYVKANVREGFLSKCETKLKEWRTSVKKEAADLMVHLKACEDAERKEAIAQAMAILDAKQLGIKVLMNAMYGFLGTKGDKSFFVCHNKIIVPADITLTGRATNITACQKYIEWVRDGLPNAEAELSILPSEAHAGKVKVVFRGAADRPILDGWSSSAAKHYVKTLVSGSGVFPSIIYGDTDSFFCTHPLVSTREMGNIADQLLRPYVVHINEFFQEFVGTSKQIVAIEHEKICFKIVNMKKKRYIGYTYDFDKAPSIYFKGVECARASMTIMGQVIQFALITILNALDDLVGLDVERACELLNHQPLTDPQRQAAVRTLLDFATNWTPREGWCKPAETDDTKLKIMSLLPVLARGHSPRWTETLERNLHGCSFTPVKIVQMMVVTLLVTAIRAFLTNHFDHTWLEVSKKLATAYKKTKPEHAIVAEQVRNRALEPIDYLPGMRVTYVYSLRSHATARVAGGKAKQPNRKKNVQYGEIAFNDHLSEFHPKHNAPADIYLDHRKYIKNEILQPSLRLIYLFFPGRSFMEKTDFITTCLFPYILSFAAADVKRGEIPFEHLIPCIACDNAANPSLLKKSLICSSCKDRVLSWKVANSKDVPFDKWSSLIFTDLPRI